MQKKKKQNMSEGRTEANLKKLPKGKIGTTGTTKEH